MSGRIAAGVSTVAGLIVALPLAVAPGAAASPFDASQVGRWQTELSPTFATQPVGTNRIVTLQRDGRSAQEPSAPLGLSADGRCLAFISGHPGRFLRESGVADHQQLYVRDLTTGAVELLSRAPDGRPSDRDIDSMGGMSADGLLITFSSRSRNLVPGDDDNETDVFLLNRTTGEIRLVSHTPAGQPGNRDSVEPAISADGTRIVFESAAKDLLPPGGPTLINSNVYSYDVATGQVSLVSRAVNGGEGDGDSSEPEISANGDSVVFTSDARNLMASPDENSSADVFLYDVPSGDIELVSRQPPGQKDAPNIYPTISADGSTVAFSSGFRLTQAPVQEVRPLNVYVYRRGAPAYELASPSVDGSAPDATSFQPELSGDGRLVSYVSFADNLDPQDINGFKDIFVYDTSTHTNLLISRARSGVSANGTSEEPVMASDGAFVAYRSDATNLVRRGDNDVDDVFVYRIS